MKTRVKLALQSVAKSMALAGARGAHLDTATNQISTAQRNAAFTLQPEPVSIQLEFTLTLTPALSPRRGRMFSSAGEGSPFRDFPSTALVGPLSSAERVRVRASLISDCIVP